MAYFSMEASAWILAIITIDRYLILVNNKWKQKYSTNIKFNLFIIFLVLFVIFLINLPVGILNGRLLLTESKQPVMFQNNASFVTTKTSILFLNKNKTTDNNNLRSNRKKVECYGTTFIKIYSHIALFIECIVPLCFMIVFNYLLIKKTYKSTTRLNSATQNNISQQQQQQQKQQTSTPQLQQIGDDANHKNDDDEENKYKQRRASSNNFLYPRFNLNNKKKNTFNSTANYDDYISKGGKVQKNNVDIRLGSSSFNDLQYLQKHNSDSSSNENRNGSRKNENFLNVKNAFFYEESDDEQSNSDTVGGGRHSSRGPHLNLNAIRSCTRKKESTFKKSKSGAGGFYMTTSFTNLSDLNPQTNLTMNYNSSAAMTPSTQHFYSSSYYITKKVNTLRNKRIVIMLSLLTLSFTISTLPSSLFYTFFRPMVYDKPYRRLLTMSFILLRHLSHAFNFIIYFTSSSVIKSQLKDIFNKKLLHNRFSLNSLNCCCCFVKDLMCPKSTANRNSNTININNNNRSNTSNNNNNQCKTKGFNLNLQGNCTSQALKKSSIPSIEVNGVFTATLKTPFTTTPMLESSSSKCSQSCLKKANSSKNNLLLLHHQQHQNNTDTSSQNTRNVTFRKQIVKFRQNSLITLNSLSSLSDLKAYYNSVDDTDSKSKQNSGNSVSNSFDIKNISDSKSDKNEMARYKLDDNYSNESLEEDGFMCKKVNENNNNNNFESISIAVPVLQNSSNSKFKKKPKTKPTHL
jgi:hypothetical protein